MSTEERDEITVQEMIDRCNEAASMMSRDNPHRLVILNMARALSEVTIRLEAEQRMVSELVRYSADLDNADHQGRQFWTMYGENALLEGTAIERGVREREYSAINAAMERAVQGIIRAVRLMLDQAVAPEVVKKSGLILMPGNETKH